MSRPAGQSYRVLRTACDLTKRRLLCNLCSQRSPRYCSFYIVSVCLFVSRLCCVITACVRDNELILILSYLIHYDDYIPLRHRHSDTVLAVAANRLLTSGQSILTTGCIAAARGRFNDIRQVAPV